MLAWHFLSADYRLRYGDGRLVFPGETLSATGPIEACSNGMHGSRKILDALRYATGPILCRVNITGDLKESDDKIAGRHRKCIWTLDTTMILHEFACWCAEQVLDENSDPRSINAVAVKRLWISGKATDIEMDVAWGAARGAARDSAWGAARDSARGAQEKQITKMIKEIDYATGYEG